MKRNGFTMLELLVVIGIIAVLAAALLAVFGTANESAYATKCLSNMRSLANAANAYAMRSDWYPLAGSREAIGVGVGGTYYAEHIGWISWLSNRGDPFGTKRDNAQKPKNFVSIEVCPFYGTGNDEDVEYALTNGTVFVSAGRNRDIYLCPAHVQYRKDHHLSKPYWSYVMNAYFKYDSSKGERATATVGYDGIRYGTIAKADRLVMFAELPTVKMNGDGTFNEGSDGDRYACDCTLQYKSTIGGDNFNTVWKGEAEELGFNHLVGKRGRCAHVVYADGHTAKIMPVQGGLSLQDLTALLCAGKDVAYDGKNYKYLRDNE